jgi:uncharacterized protein
VADDFGFEWDSTKAGKNLSKHGISFEEAMSVFADPIARLFDDPDQSVDELREIIVGHSERARLLVVSFTERPPRVRIFSARKATRRERRSHEESL